MRSLKGIVAVAIVGMMLVSWLPVQIQAATILATVKSKTEATLSGDGSTGVEASYETTGSSKDRLTKGDKAVMTLSSLPEGTIDYIALSMHSNTSSGSGTLRMTLDSKVIASVSDKAFSEWPGQTEYSKDYVKVWFTGDWSMTSGSTLCIEIEASANSLYFGSVELGYSAAAPKPYTVTLRWNTPEGDKEQRVTEKSVGTGVVLPECEQSAFDYDGEQWVCVGWTDDRIVAKMMSEPKLYAIGTTFYPQRNTTLYAVYKTAHESVPVMQDTLYRTGVYAMVMQAGGDYYLVNGKVQGKNLAAKECEVEKTKDGRYRLMQDYVPLSARYEVTVDGEDVRMRHIETDRPIGHTTTDVAENEGVWSWKKGLNHSTALYFSPQTEKDGSLSGRLLMPISEDLTASYTFTTRLVSLIDDYEYMLLFDMEDVPTVVETRWTTHPFGWSGIVKVRGERLEGSGRKIMRDGVVVIERGGKEYDLTGRQQ